MTGSLSAFHALTGCGRRVGQRVACRSGSTGLTIATAIWVIPPQMKRSASEYFARNIWISADPDERSLPYMVELVGDDKFFIGSDYPHAEGFVRPVEKARAALARLPEESIDKILGDNAVRFFGL